MSTALPSLSGLDAALFRRIERVFLHSWPADREHESYDGWELRFRLGGPRRANSVSTLAPSHLPLADKLAHCRRRYGVRGTRLTIRCNDFVDQPALDQLLAGERFERSPDCLVLCCPLPLPEAAAPGTCRTLELPDWSRLIDALHGNEPEDDEEVASHLAERIPAKLLPLALETADGEYPAALMGALADGCAGVFDLVVAPTHRRRGHARALLRHFLTQAWAAGADLAWLQVLAGNAPALALYEAMGFEVAYRYWYRTEPV